MCVHQCGIKLFLLCGGSYIRNIVVSSLSLLLLELDGDTSHRALLDPPHQVGHEPVVVRFN